MENFLALLMLVFIASYLGYDIYNSYKKRKAQQKESTPSPSTTPQGELHDSGHMHQAPPKTTEKKPGVTPPESETPNPSDEPENADKPDATPSSEDEVQEQAYLNAEELLKKINTIANEGLYQKQDPELCLLKIKQLLTQK